MNTYVALTIVCMDGLLAWVVFFVSECLDKTPGSAKTCGSISDDGFEHSKHADASNYYVVASAVFVVYYVKLILPICIA